MLMTAAIVSNIEYQYHKVDSPQISEKEDEYETQISLTTSKPTVWIFCLNFFLPI